MIRYVTKSNGKKEEFNPEKLRKWSEFAAGKLNWSEIELEAVKRCYDGVSTRDLHKAMIAACIDKKTQAYSDMAGRLLLGMIYKQAHGGFHSIPSLLDFYKDMVSKGHWTKMDYTDEEIVALGKLVKHDKNLGYGYSVLRQMADKYLVRDAVNDIVFESPQFLFMGVAMSVMQIQPKERRMEDIKWLYTYVSDLKINLPSPYLTTLRTTIPGSASCCLFRADDNAESLAIANYLAHEYTLNNAGIGVNLQTRATGQGVKNNRIVHGGLLPYLKWMEDSVGASKQASRGGSATVTYTILEPDFDELIRLKNPTTPVDKRVDKLDYSVVVNRSFLRRAAKGEDWMLVSYDEAPELYAALYESEEVFDAVYDKVSRKRIKKKIVKARDLLSEIIVQRAETGRVYMFFADNVNGHTPFLDTIFQSNLCQEIFLPTKSFDKMMDLFTGENTENQELALCFLSSIVAGRVKPEEYENVAYYCLLTVDNVIETMVYPFKHNEITAKARRSVGIGITNLAHYLASNFVNYSDPYGKKLIHELAERHYFWLASASLRLAKEKGNAEWIDKTKWPQGWLPIDTYAKAVDDIGDFPLKHDWETLRQEIIAQGGIRNSVLAAIAPNESSSLVSNTTNSVYPVRDTMMFKQSQRGSVLFIVPDYDKLKSIYQSAWDTPAKDIAECYGLLTKFLDQGLSADEWADYTKMEGGRLSIKDRMKFILLFAKYGGKSLYYMNSRVKSAESLAQEDNLVEPDCEGCSM
ncbi:ribonucleotide reductase of class Ia (aerobic), alpha subunit [Citrobacter phage Tr1]|nr:ribonucleotide reductase of class Ia (aerobic), alpha subunit [Citrobacter phage Tr1]